MPWLMLIEVLRPRHWIKSGFCMAALFFSGQAGEPSAWLMVLPIVVAFSLLSSAGYVVNDLVNCAEDQRHPLKRLRPIASGRLTRRAALILALLVASGALGLCYYSYAGRSVFLCLVAYGVLSLGYTFFLRAVPYWDVLVLSGGFVLRVCAGAFAVEVRPSEWLILLTYLVAVLLAFGKRRGELRSLNKKELPIGITRRSLQDYEGGTLSTVIDLVTFLTIGSYLAFCFVVKGGGWFLLTAIPVVTALFSYVREVGCSERVEIPERMIFQNKTLLISFATWVGLILFFLYGWNKQ